MENTKLQSFPIYYRMEPREFTAGSIRSGAAGATAKLSFSTSNDVNLIRGIRVCNTYDLPVAGSSQADIALWMANREIDDDQSLTLQFANATSVINGVHQKLVCGEKGLLWHAFAHPYVVKSGTTINVELNRLTSYSTIGAVPILPIAHVTLWVERLVDGANAHEGAPRGAVYGGG